MGAEAAVRAGTERDVVGGLAPQVHFEGPFEALGVAVADREREHHHLPRADRAAADLDVPCRLAGGDDERVDAEDLLDRRGDQRRVVDDRPALFRMRGEVVEGPADGDRDRVEAGLEQQDAERVHVPVADRLVVDRPGHGAGQQVVAGCLAAQRDLLLEVVRHGVHRAQLPLAVRVFAVGQMQQVVDPVEELREILLGQPHQTHEDQGREAAGERVEDVGGTAVLQPVDQAGRDLPDLRFTGGDRLGREGAAQQAPPRGVLGRVEHLRDPQEPGVRIERRHGLVGEGPPVLQRLLHGRTLGDDPVSARDGAAESGVGSGDLVPAFLVAEDRAAEPVVEVVGGDALVGPVGFECRAHHGSSRTVFGMRTAAGSPTAVRSATAVMSPRRRSSARSAPRRRDRVSAGPRRCVPRTAVPA